MENVMLSSFHDASNISSTSFRSLGVRPRSLTKSFTDEKLEARWIGFFRVSKSEWIVFDAGRDRFDFVCFGKDDE